MVTVNIHEAKTHLSKLVDQAVKGEAFVIAKAGRPLVKVTALGAPSEPQRLGFLAGEIAVPEDFNRIGRGRNRRPLRKWDVKLLLDTDLLLWAAGQPKRLSAAARKLLNDPGERAVLQRRQPVGNRHQEHPGPRRLPRRAAPAAARAARQRLPGASHHQPARSQH